jgi:hypothetical protein
MMTDNEIDEITSTQSAGPAPEPAAPEPASPEPARQAPSSDSRNIGAIAHLSAFAMFAGVPSFIGPLVVWLLTKDRDQFAAGEAREALNFNLSLLLYTVAAIVVMIATLGLGLIVIVPVALIAAPAWLILTVLAAIRAADGQPYRYPLTLRLIN